VAVGGVIVDRCSKAGKAGRVPTAPTNRMRERKLGGLRNTGVHDRSRARGAGIPVGATAVSLAALVLIAPLATSAQPPLRLVAPYGTSVAVHLSKFAASQNCSSFRFPLGPSFNLTTGDARGSVRTSATGCGAPLGTTVRAFQYVDVIIRNVTVASTGAHTVNATWDFRILAAMSVSNNSGSSKGWADWSVVAWDSLRDLTSGTWTNGSATLVGNGTIAWINGNSTTHIVATNSILLTGHLVPGHVYRFFTHLAIAAYSTILRGTGAHSQVLVDWGTHGNRARLLSLAVS
jgi:hypothetical protein